MAHALLELTHRPRTHICYWLFSLFSTADVESLPAYVYVSNSSNVNDHETKCGKGTGNFYSDGKESNNVVCSTGIIGQYVSIVRIMSFSICEMAVIGAYKPGKYHILPVTWIYSLCGVLYLWCSVLYITLCMVFLFLSVANWLHNYCVYDVSYHAIRYV